MQRILDLAVWVSAIALWASAGSHHWVQSEQAVGGLTSISPCPSDIGDCPACCTAGWINWRRL